MFNNSKFHPQIISITSKYFGNQIAYWIRILLCNNGLKMNIQLNVHISEQDSHAFREKLHCVVNKTVQICIELF